MNITQSKNYITYPFSSKITYKNEFPFIRIITNNHIYYGYHLKQLLLIDINSKEKIQIFNQYQIPDNKYHSIFNHVTSKIKGINYQLLYINKNQYLCLGRKENKYISIIIITIDLNSKGYYEIQGIRNILK